MTLPATPTVEIRLGVGAAFGPVFQFGDSVHGRLGYNLLGSSTIDVVDVSSTTQRISI